MRKLKNTLYITSPEAYLSLEGENIVILLGDKVSSRVPLHNIEGIVTTGFKGASPALMGKCASEGIDLCFLSGSGRFLARIEGRTQGNVLLRREQFRIADDEKSSLDYARSFLIGKFYNSRSVLERSVRDYPLRLDTEKIKEISARINDSVKKARICTDTDILRGIEGECASRYFSVFDDLILQQKEDFKFETRNKRPPLDNVNAMLSFAYVLLAEMCVSALEAVGLDPYVGFMHTDRPGRKSLALDLMEELRSIYADRFVLTLINKKIISAKGFIQSENGSVRMDDPTRRLFLAEWQKRKTEMITHPFLKEKVEWGVVPYTQALLLARTIRGDLDAYPPFLWK